MNNDQLRVLTREFLQNLGGGLPEDNKGILTEQARAPTEQDEAPSRGQAVRQSWGELMEVLVEAVMMARAFNRLNDPEGVGEPPAEETGFGGSEAAEMSSLLQDIWEGAGFHADEIFK